MVVRSLTGRSGIGAALGAALLLSAGSANALDINSVYNVQEAPVDSAVYSGGGGHAFYIPTLLYGSNDEKFVVDNNVGMTFGYDSGASQWILDGRIVTDATKNLSLSSQQAFDVHIAFDSTTSGSKLLELNNCAYVASAGGTGTCGSIDPSTWMLFSENTNPGPEMTGVAGSAFDGASLALTFNTTHPFEAGVGASGKNLDLGASGWYSYTLSVASNTNASSHGLYYWKYANGNGDVNVNLSDNGTFQVPEPGAVTILAAGLFGLGVMRRRRKRRGAV